MSICKNSACFQSYQSTDGVVVVRLLHLLSANHDEKTEPAPANIQRLRDLAPRIYQPGFVCAGCGLDMASAPGPTESPEVNYLLKNSAVLGIYGVVV